MRSVLLRIAYWIWKRYAFERFPPFYYNGRKYQITSIKYNNNPDDPDASKYLVVRAKENT